MSGNEDRPPQKKSKTREKKQKEKPSTATSGVWVVWVKGDCTDTQDDLPMIKSLTKSKPPALVKYEKQRAKRLCELKKFDLAKCRELALIIKEVEAEINKGVEQFEDEDGVVWTVDEFCEDVFETSLSTLDCDEMRITHVKHLEPDADGRVWFGSYVVEGGGQSYHDFQTLRVFGSRDRAIQDARMSFWDNHCRDQCEDCPDWNDFIEALEQPLRCGINCKGDECESDTCLSEVFKAGKAFRKAMQKDMRHSKCEAKFVKELDSDGSADYGYYSDTSVQILSTKVRL